MSTSADADGGVRAAIDLVREQAVTWFPDLDGAVSVRLERTLQRPRCRLHVLAVGAGHRVLIKQRLTSEVHAGGWGSETRPRLAALPGPDEDPTGLEAQGLRMAEELVLECDNPRLRAVRLLGYLPVHRVLIVDHVPRPTLRDLLHDVVRGRLLRRPVGSIESLVEGCGEWLRRFHAQPARHPVRPRGLERDQLVDLARSYAGFLEGRRDPDTLASRLSGLCAGVLVGDGVGPGAVTHGDFAARNVFTWPDPSVAVFDPMPRWLAPAYEDLARFVVELRSMGALVTTGGRAIGLGRLEDFERALFLGYFGVEPVPWESLRAHQALLLLDKWAAVTSRPRPPARVISAVIRGRDTLIIKHLRREAALLLARSSRAVWVPP